MGGSLSAGVAATMKNDPVISKAISASTNGGQRKLDSFM
jgi:hypothetical protein